MLLRVFVMLVVHKLTLTHAACVKMPDPPQTKSLSNCHAGQRNTQYRTTNSQFHAYKNTRKSTCTHSIHMASSPPHTHRTKIITSYLSIVLPLHNNQFKHISLYLTLCSRSFSVFLSLCWSIAAIVPPHRTCIGARPSANENVPAPFGRMTLHTSQHQEKQACACHLSIDTHVHMKFTPPTSTQSTRGVSVAAPADDVQGSVIHITRGMGGMGSVWGMPGDHT